MKDKVVTVTMYGKLNEGTDYFFKFGDAEAVKFPTAKNDIKYATGIVIKTTSAYVGDETPIKYAFVNEDGVELSLTEVPTFTYTSDVAYVIGTTIYFDKAGSATIKAEFDKGWDDVNNKADILTASATITGVTKSATGSIYSFSGSATDQKHTIRIGDETPTNPIYLNVRYAMPDGTYTYFNSKDHCSAGSYYLKSTDETVVMIAGGNVNEIKGVNKGSAAIVICDSEGNPQGAFPITVDVRNKVTSATVTPSKNTLNLGGAGDSITVTVSGTNLDGKDDSAFTYSIEQYKGNEASVKVKYTPDATETGAWTGSKQFKIEPADINVESGAAEYATVRYVVTVKDASSTKILEKVLTFTVSAQNTPNKWQITGSKTLDNSIKNFDWSNPGDQNTTVKIQQVKTSSYGDFYVGDENFYLVDSVAAIPATSNAAEVKYYVVRSYPTYDDTNVNKKNPMETTATANATGAKIDIKAFPTETTRAQIGTYSFAGYSVKYETGKNGIRTNLGNASVVISRSDVVAKASILNGKAKYFEENMSSPIETIFRVSWEGLSTNDGWSNRIDNGTVTFTKDAQSGAYYCSKLTVRIKLSRNQDYYFYQDIPVGELFKSEND